MQRTYIPIKNEGDSIPGWPAGAIRYFLHVIADETDPAVDTSCDGDDTAFLTMANPITSPTIPANLPDMEWVPRDCAGAAFDPEDTAFTFDPDYANTPNPTTPGSDYTGATVIVSSNREVMNPVVEYNAQGQARIVDTVNRDGVHWYFITGQAPLHSLPTAYTLQPGDQVSMFLAICDSPYLYQNPYNIKATAKVLIGLPPTV